MRPRHVAVVLLAALSLAMRPAQLLAGEADKPAGSPDTFSLDVSQAKLENVLRLISKQYGLNLVAGKEVTGTVTLHLHGVTVDEALDAVLRSNGFEYERKGNLLEVRPIAPPKEPAPPPPTPAPAPITRYVPLRYANGKDLVDTLRALVPKDAGIFEYNEKRNAFLIQDAPEAVERVESILREIDKKTVQVRIEAKIVETLLGEHDRLGIDWATSLRLSGANRPVTFPFLESVKGGAFFPINNGEGTLTSVSTSTATASSTNASAFSSRSGFPLGQRTDFSFGHLDASEFTAVLEALQANTETKLVASPEVTTLDNQQAKITIGSIVPVPTYTHNEERGTTSLTGYQKIEVGTTLLVTPRVNDEKTVTLYLKPEVSEIVGFRGPMQEFPMIEQRSAETSVVLEDGKTLVIGGLVREHTFEKTSKFPLLGDIPLLGYLFTYHGQDKEKTNLLIFITPHILDPERMENEQRGMARLEGRWVPRDAAARVTALRTALASDSHEQRALAAAALGSNLGDIERMSLKPVETLEALFRGDPSPEVRATALVTLSGIDPDRVQAILSDPRICSDPDAAAPLALVSLREPSVGLRTLATRAAGMAGCGEALRRFEDAVRSPDPAIRARAASAIAEMGDRERALSMLEALLEDPDPLVVLAALEGIADGPVSHPASLATPTAPIGQLALGSSDDLIRRAALQTVATLSRPVAARATTDAIGAAPSECSVQGEGPGVFKVRQAITWLSEKSPRYGHLVRLSFREIVLTEGPTRVLESGRRFEISARDAESWPLASLSHQLVHYAVHSFLARTGRNLLPAVEEAACFEEQYRAVHAIAGEGLPGRPALAEFVRSAVRRAGEAPSRLRPIRPSSEPSIDRGSIQGTATPVDGQVAEGSR